MSLSIVPKPVHEHDCTDFIHLGSVYIENQTLDLYECPRGMQSAIVRYGKEGEYWSMPRDIVDDLERYPIVLGYRQLWLALKEVLYAWGTPKGSPLRTHADREVDGS